MPRLELSGVRKAYGATVALAHGDLTLEPGEAHVLMGSNGSGKSTLCKIAAGSVRPDAGRITLDGREVDVSGPMAARSLGVGIFYQELSLAPHRTVAENISLADPPARRGFLDRRAIRARAEALIERFRGVEGEGLTAEARVGDLRADQRQLVEIMKTLGTQAPILIFDEPTSALDRAQTERFFAILRELKAEGRAIVFISHRMDEIFEIGDRVTVIRDGETVWTARLAETDADTVIRKMVGERSAAPQAADAPRRPERAAPEAEPVLVVTDLFAPSVAGLDFTAHAGEILGFGGLHGQGQSATLRVLFGALSRERGTVTLKGELTPPGDPRATIRRGFAYVSGDRGRDGAITGRPILENLAPVHLLKRRLRLARPSKLREAAAGPLEALAAKYETLGHSIASLSGGNQQKILIARWLIDRPEVLLLDDPTKGVDLSAKTELFALIRRLAGEGMAILLYSSEDEELLSNADRILVFNGGRIVRELRGSERTRGNLYRAAYEAADG